MTGTTNWLDDNFPSGTPVPPPAFWSTTGQPLLLLINNSWCVFEEFNQGVNPLPDRPSQHYLFQGSNPPEALRASLEHIRQPALQIGYPWSTLLVNGAGSLLIGLVWGAAAETLWFLTVR